MSELDLIAHEVRRVSKAREEARWNKQWELVARYNAQLRDLKAMEHTSI